MKVCIIGTGYIGLTEGLCFADLGHDVVCHDVVREKIDQLNQGVPVLYEDGLEEMLKRNLKNGKISFTTDLSDALNNADVVFICVNTPENPKDGSADLSAVRAVAKSIAETINNDKKFVLVIRSTVPVGTNREIEKLVRDTNGKLNFSIASNPEFSKQGSAIDDFLRPDRIIVGVADEYAKTVMSAVYKPLTDRGAPILFTSIETAELIKYATNTFLAMKVAFINEIADICEKTGANVAEIAQAMGMDKRISPYFLQAGPGIGGSCFPKDSIALVQIGKKYGLECELLAASVDSNRKRKHRMADKILNASSTNLNGKKIAILGLAFKANTDDTRYSPAISIAEELAKNNVYMNVYDPKGMPKYKTMVSNNVLDHTAFFENPYDAIKDCELLAIITEWSEFRELDYTKIYELLKQKTIVDYRNLLNPEDMKKIGFRYVCIGK